jgi:peptide/nickel transport system permease protein
MAASLLRRLLAAAGTWLLLTVLLYAAVHAIPGSAVIEEDTGASASGSPQGRPHDAERPDSVMSGAAGYVDWLSAVARLDFGVSRGVEPGRPVSDLLRDALPWSMALGALALLLTVALAAPLSFLGAWRPGSLTARLGEVVLHALPALPVFWMALVLQQILAVRLGWLPLMGPGTGGMAGAAHWVLPAASLSLGSLALAMRLIGDALHGAARARPSLAARARGASRRRVLLTQGMAEAGTRMVSLAALMLPGLVSGSVLVESIFSLPGAGRLFFVAASRRDLPVLMAVSLVAAAATLAASLLADAAYRLLDPRLRRAGAEDPS